jgi:hypothetical protein
MIAQLAMLGGGMALKGIGRAIANQKLEELKKNMPKYKENALATTLLNARMPGAAQAERNILAEQANMLGKSQQAATSSSDIMQQIGGLQSQTNQALQGLAGQEAADYQRRYGNYINEQDKAFADQLRQFQTIAQIEGAKQENMQNTFGDIANLGMGLANFEAAGGFTGTGLAGLTGKAATSPTPSSLALKQQTMPFSTSTVGAIPGQGMIDLTARTMTPPQYNDSYNPNSPNYNPLFSSPNPYISMMNNMQGYLPMFNQNMGYNYGMKR